MSCILQFGKLDFEGATEPEVEAVKRNGKPLEVRRFLYNKFLNVLTDDRISAIGKFNGDIDSDDNNLKN